MLRLSMSNVQSLHTRIGLVNIGHRFKNALKGAAIGTILIGGIIANDTTGLDTAASGGGVELDGESAGEGVGLRIFHLFGRQTFSVVSIWCGTWSVPRSGKRAASAVEF